MAYLTLEETFMLSSALVEYSVPIWMEKQKRIEPLRNKIMVLNTHHLLVRACGVNHAASVVTKKDVGVNVRRLALDHLLNASALH